jgi:hypothetical protein
MLGMFNWADLNGIVIKMSYITRRALSTLIPPKVRPLGYPNPIPFCLLT